MSEYRLYCLNAHDRFARSNEISASDDGEALAKAKAMKLSTACEVRNRQRLVAKLPAEK